LSRQQPDNGQNPENQQNSFLHQQVAKSLKKICCSTTYSKNFKQVIRKQQDLLTLQTPAAATQLQDCS
jgi:hypothetical protein